MNDKNSLTHTRWSCKYHIVFAPEYRRKAFYKGKRIEEGKTLRMLCGWKKVKIVGAKMCPNHLHMLMEFPPIASVSIFMGYPKEKAI